MPEWRSQIRTRLAPLRLTPTREAEILDELVQHLDERYEELRRAGESEMAAERLAAQELAEPDALTRHMRVLRQARTPPPLIEGAPPRRLLADLWRDLRYASRMLRKQPGFKDEITFLASDRDEAVAISLWDKKESAEAYSREAYPAILQKLERVVEGTPQVESYEVANSTFHKISAPSQSFSQPTTR